jgi:hypothetical protein
MLDLSSNKFVRVTYNFGDLKFLIVWQLNDGIKKQLCSLITSRGRLLCEPIIAVLSHSVFSHHLREDVVRASVD